jgi:alanine dehydrogenase
MLITVPRETKPGETRVGVTPAGALALRDAGHEVWIESRAGAASHYADDLYEAAGARVVLPAEAWSGELVVKVKEPLPEEYALLSGNALFAYLHLAANAPLAAALTSAGTLGISYDTVRLDDGSLPLLAPMSRIAGRLAVTEGAHHLLAQQGGRGVLLPSVGALPGADVVVLGAGVAGSEATRLAASMGARVTVLDLDEDRLAALTRELSGRVTAARSTPESVRDAVHEADLVIGAVLVPGRRAPHVVTREMVAAMRPGSVLVDIAIDQGGCFEDSRPTTHADPTFLVEKSIFYCVANMPGAAGHTSTKALTDATLPYVIALASGVEEAIAADPSLAAGVNTRAGEVVHPDVLAGLAHS